MNENLKFCARLKTEYYVKNIKMLYNWSCMNEDSIFECLNALGLFDYIDAIKWLLLNKSRLNAEINNTISDFAKEDLTPNERAHALNRLKIALVICNKNQAVKIISSIVLYSSNPKENVNYLSTF